MARVITFSRAFPSKHPKQGEPTHFVEQLVNSFITLGYCIEDIGQLCHDSPSLCLDEDIKTLKVHTIRKGNRWKVGDKFSPRVWSGKPYQSKQIKIAEDIEVKKIWDFEMDDCGVISINGQYIDMDGSLEDAEKECTNSLLAKNDGLSLMDMHYWFIPPGTFKKFEGFKGQIICWDESVNY